MPWTVVNLDLYSRDWRPPSGAFYSVLAILACDSRRGRLEADWANSGECPDGLAVTLLLMYIDVVPRHKAAGIAAVQHLNTGQPLDIGDSVPARGYQAHWETVLMRKRLAVHFVAKQVVTVERFVN